MPHSSYSAFKQYQTGRRLSPMRAQPGRPLGPPPPREPMSPYEHDDPWDAATYDTHTPRYSGRGSVERDTQHSRPGRREDRSRVARMRSRDRDRDDHDRERERERERDTEEDQTYIFRHERHERRPQVHPPRSSGWGDRERGRVQRSPSPPSQPFAHREGSHERQRLRYDDDWEDDWAPSSLDHSGWDAHDRQHDGGRDASPPRGGQRGGYGSQMQHSERRPPHHHQPHPRRRSGSGRLPDSDAGRDDWGHASARHLEDELRHCKQQLSHARAESDALRRELAAKSEALILADRELRRKDDLLLRQQAGGGQSEGRHARHSRQERQERQERQPPADRPSPGPTPSHPPPSQRSQSSDKRKEPYVPRQLQVRVPSQPLAEGLFVLRPGELLNGWPVWGCEDRRLYSGAREYWLVTDESCDMPKSRGYVQSSRQHDGLMPQQVAEWKIFDDDGWVVDPSVRITLPQGGGGGGGGGAIAGSSSLKRAPAPGDRDSGVGGSGGGGGGGGARAPLPGLTKVASGDGPPSVSWKVPPQSHAPLVVGFDALTASHAATLKQGARYLKYSLHKQAEEKKVSVSEHDSLPYLQYRDVTGDTPRKKVAVNEVNSISLGPFESYTFTKGPTKVRDAGLCFSISVKDAILDFEASSQDDLVAIVSGLSLMLQGKLQGRDQIPLTSVGEIEAAQRGVRHLWGNAQKFLTL